MRKVKVLKRTKESFRFSLSTIIMILFCTLLLITSTFVVVGIHHYLIPTKPSLVQATEISMGLLHKDYWYISQIPALFFIAVFLGRRFGLMSVCLYILLGLIYFPIFAFGGGYKYLAHYNFGYILSFIPAVIVITHYLKKFSVKNAVKADLAGVVCIHLVGILYLILIGAIKHDSMSYISGILFVQTTAKVLYDIIYCFIAIFVARVAKKIILALFNRSID